MKKDQSLGTAIRTTNHDIKVYLDRCVNLYLPNSLTGIEGIILGYIFHHNAVCANDIRKRFHLQKGTVSEAFSKLVEKGYIEVNVDKTDKRKKTILLTEKGRNAHQEFEELYNTLIPTIEKGISEEDKVIFLRVCNQIKANIGAEDYE